MLEMFGVGGLALLVLTMLARGRDVAHIAPTLGLFVMAAFRLMPSVNRIMTSIVSLGYGLPVINALHSELALAPVVPRRAAERGRRRTVRCDVVSNGKLHSQQRLLRGVYALG